MNDIKTCYRNYICSEEYEKNDGWSERLWNIIGNIELFVVPIDKQAFCEIESGLSSYAAEVEARGFAAGYNSAMKLWATRFMQSSQEDWTDE